ncbi:MAG: porin [Kiloniellaceae bacterium]
MRPLEHPSLKKHLRSTVRAALVGTAALAFVGGAPAWAGELDELKAQIEALRLKVEELEAKQAETAKEAKEAKEAAERQPLAAPQRVVTSGKDDVKLTLSGQVNRVSFFGDDGTESNFFHSDNENSSTRWRLVGSGRIDDEWSVGTLIEQDIGQTNNSSAVKIDQDSSVSDVSFDNRHLTAWLDSKRFGRLWLGKGNTASNNITQIDLSGTTVIEYSGLEDIGGGLEFRTDGAPAPDGPKVSGGSDAVGSGVYSQFDGLSRRNRIEYDTPTLMGFKAGFSHSQGDAWDATLRHSANFEQVGLKLAAGFGYWEYGSRTDVADSAFGGSISVLHDSGANLTFSGGTFDREAETATKSDDPFGIFIKPGWQLKLTPLGKTAVSGHYARADDMQRDGDEFTSWGFAAVQHIDRAALELFGFFRQYDLDRPGTDFEAINLAGFGARVKF